LEDEAYYWVWSKNLAFGYFDHPPLVAVWVKISSLFFDNELGVRFFSTISFSLMLLIIWGIIEVPKKRNYVWLYFLLVSSVALLNVYGFITTPDTPLLLFVALFLLAYKKFLQNKSLLHILLLGFSMAAMLYSKYHGVLVIFFVVLSNLKLLKNKKFWIAGVVGFILFSPHLYWQYANDFPSVRYHLLERGNRPYSINNTLMHFVNQIAIVGITFPLIYTAFFKRKNIRLFEKSLVYIVYGTILFFFFSTFKSRPQAQWTGVILIPLIILTFPYFIEHQKARKRLVILGVIQFLIILVARLFLANDTISPIQLEPHISKTWVNPLKEKTENKPIVFINSYRNASVYRFYTGIQTHSYSDIYGRKSQYDLMNTEKIMQNKSIVAVGKWIAGDTLVKKRKKIYYGITIDNYKTFQQVACTILEKEIILNPKGENILAFELTNTYEKPINFEHVSFVGFFQGNKNKILKKITLSVKNLKSLKAGEKVILEASFVTPKILFDSNTTFRVSMQFYGFPGGYQGNKVPVKIVE